MLGLSRVTQAARGRMSTLRRTYRSSKCTDGGETDAPLIDRPGPETAVAARRMRISISEYFSTRTRVVEIREKIRVTGIIYYNSSTPCTGSTATCAIYTKFRKMSFGDVNEF